MFEPLLLRHSEGPTYDVSPNCERFLTPTEGATPDGNASPLQIITVLNWFEELKERVPVP